MRETDVDRRLVTMKRISLCVVGVALTICGFASAEDVTGSDKLLCAGVEAMYCDSSGECEFGHPLTWNMPEFLEIHLDEKMLRTTPAAPRLRESPIVNLQRNDGQIFLQGVENARAYSIVVDEVTGVATIAIATNGITISVFAACTPLAAGE